MYIYLSNLELKDTAAARVSDWPRERSVLEEKMSCKSDKWLTFLGGCRLQELAQRF